MTDKQKDNRKKALEDLLVQVEGGAFDATKDRVARFNDFRRLAETAFVQDVTGQNALSWNAYKGSLDAAKALHEAALPGRSWEIWRVDNDEQVPFYGVNIPNVDTPYSATPARAWIIAILKALIAKATP